MSEVVFDCAHLLVALDEEVDMAILVESRGIQALLVGDYIEDQQ